VSILRVEELILGDRRIAVRDIASNGGINVAGVDTITHEHLFFKKVCTRWVPKLLTFDQRAQHVAVFAENLHRFELERNTFLERIVTCD
jgi:hypothetical protein